MKLHISKGNVVDGIFAGILGGLALSFMLWQMCLIRTTDMVVYMSNPIAGLLCGLIVSGCLGAIFAIFFSKLVKTFLTGAIWGGIYGVMWWFCGTLTLFPMAVGLPVMWNATTMNNKVLVLIAQVVAGAVTGLFYIYLRKKESR